MPASSISLLAAYLMPPFSDRLVILVAILIALGVFGLLLNGLRKRADRRL